MSVIKRAFSALGKLGIIVAIAIAFFVGLLGTIYYSLRSREVNVPNVVGKDVLEGEKALDRDGLNMRRRATRYSPNAKPNTILDQSPHAGEIIKVGQTVAVVVSRASAKEGEEGILNSSEVNVATEDKNTNTASASSKNDNENSNKANKNTRNKNSNNSNNGNANNSNVTRNSNANNSNNRNANALNSNNRNVSNGNSNANRGTSNSNRTTNSGTLNENSGRSSINSNSDKRVPAPATPPTNQNRNRRVP